MEEGSLDAVSIGSGTKRSSISSGGRIRNRNRKEFLRKFVDSEILTTKLGDWFSSILEAPFDLTEIQKLDYALEGVSFQQLIRMPNTVYASTSDTVEQIAYLAIEDFLHASAKGLWEAFWSDNGPFPFSVACLHSTTLKFYPAEKAIQKGKLRDLSATAIMLKNTTHSHGKWDHVLELALLRPNVLESGDTQPSKSVMGEALFYALRVLLSRTLSRASTLSHSNSIFVILADSQYGGVVKVEGDVTNLDFDTNNVYESAADWIKEHSEVTVSSMDRIWNKLGNANWGDIGTLQVLLATYQSIVQFAGTPKYSFEDLAMQHGPRLEIRRTERELEDEARVNGLYHYQQRISSPEIVEVEAESESKHKEKQVMSIEPGSVLWLEDSDFQRGFVINEVINSALYKGNSLEEPGRSVFLHVGSHPCELEPALEDMKLWYQVQRQTKILNLMKQRGVSSKYLPQIVSSGRLIHPGNPRTPILVTTPVGDLVTNVIQTQRFGTDEALRCCHDCLSALSTASSAGIKHGDIRPENLIQVSNTYYVVVGWGHAILEERDRPVMNLLFSSTYALQQGRLCSASDAESLVYLLYFTAGGDVPELDSVEGALQWREIAWSRRLIQQKLGEISPVLKAFADYVDSLCGTPYPMDYEIWLRRMRKCFHQVESSC